MRASSFAFVAAGLHGLTGMSLGIYMGVAQDFTLAPAHAHVNLLGWVTLALYGLYHRGRRRSSSRLAWAQIGAGAAGAPMLGGGLGYYLLTGSHQLFLLILAGSLLSLAGMALFVVVVLLDIASDRVPVGRGDGVLA